MPFPPFNEDDILTGSPQRSESLWLVPLIASPEMPRCPTYRGLENAIAEGTLTISETSSQGTVSELLASNRGLEPVLILDGDLLAGAKQDRVANASTLLPARADTTIPVSCVEAGRWAYTRRRQPQAMDRAFFIQGRARKAASVSDNLKRSRRRTSDQQQVWSDIDGPWAWSGRSESPEVSWWAALVRPLKQAHGNASIEQRLHEEGHRQIGLRHNRDAAARCPGLAGGIAGAVPRAKPRLTKPWTRFTSFDVKPAHVSLSRSGAVGWPRTTNGPTLNGIGTPLKLLAELSRRLSFATRSFSARQGHQQMGEGSSDDQQNRSSRSLRSCRSRMRRHADKIPPR